MGALGIIVGCALSVSSPGAAAFDEVRALAREKAAAVALLKRKPARQVAMLVNDRVFVAYLNATTQGEGVRIRARMTSVLSTLVGRFGIGQVALVDRSGEVVVKAGKSGGMSLAADPAVQNTFTRKDAGATSVLARGDLTHAAPVVRRGEREFVLGIRQSLTPYREALQRGVDGERFVVLLDDKGAVLCDSRDKPWTRGRLVAGMSFAALRKAVKGTRDEGAGEITRGDARYAVGYETVDGWTVLAVEAVPVPSACAKGAKRPCG